MALTDPANILLANVGLIGRITATVARRYHCSAEEAEELLSVVKVHLIENDYVVLRKYEGRSTLATYLTAVVTHVLLDWRNERWGKWRPSAAARRQGPAAILVERLVVRDGQPLEHAVAVARSRHGASVSAEDLAGLARPRPPRPREVPLDEVEDVATAGGADHEVLEQDRAALREAAAAALRSAFETLPSEDRLIVQLRVLSGLPVPRIGRSLGLDPKPLYRRLERILAALRKRLESQGIGTAHLHELLDDEAIDPRRDLRVI